MAKVDGVAGEVAGDLVVDEVLVVGRVVTALVDVVDSHQALNWLEVFILFHSDF